MEIKRLAETLEEIKKVRDDGTEYWYARELYPLLGYKKWENFQNAINRAKRSCIESGNDVEYHFPIAKKKVGLGSGSQRGIDDYKLTRYACYLIAQNGDPRIPEIAFSQMYFAIQTRKQEVLEKQIEEIERVVARKQLTETHKEFASTVLDRDVDRVGLAQIISVGDYILFGKNSTKDMKRMLRISPKRALPDFLPTVTIKAKDLAAEATTFNTKHKDLRGKDRIQAEHVKSNQSARDFLLKLDIVPEELPPSEDIKKIERKHERQMQSAGDSSKNREIQSPELLIDVIDNAQKEHFVKIKELLIKKPGNGKVIFVFDNKRLTFPQKVDISEDLSVKIMEILNSEV